MFLTSEGLTEHHRTPHVRCPDCTRKFNTLGQMFRHSRDKHGSELYQQRLTAFREKGEASQARRGRTDVVEDEFQLSLVSRHSPTAPTGPQHGPWPLVAFRGRYSHNALPPARPQCPGETGRFLGL
jgi:hypothetical protein